MSRVACSTLCHDFVEQKNKRNGNNDVSMVVQNIESNGDVDVIEENNVIELSESNNNNVVICCTKCAKGAMAVYTHTSCAYNKILKCLFASKHYLVR